MPPMHFGASCAPPAAWRAMVARRPRLALRGVQPSQAPSGKVTVDTLYRVQEAVNASILYQADARGDVWGVLGWRRIWGLTGQRWTRIGDCDDYAAEKMSRLLALGFPVNFGGSLRLVMCRYGRIAHLVLACETTEETFILDNRKAGIWVWDDPTFSSYRWIAASVPGSLRWARIGAPRTLEDAARMVT